MDGLKSKSIDTTEETLAIFEEYKRKFADAIEQERQKARRKAEDESAKLVAEAEQRARQAAERRISEAEDEAARIVARSRGLTERAANEAELVVQTISEAKEGLLTGIDQSTTRARKEVDAAIQAVKQAERALAEAKKVLLNELEALTAAAAEMRQRIDQAIRTAEDDGGRDRGEPERGKLIPAAVDVSKSAQVSGQEPVEPISPGSPRAGEEKLSVGTIDIDVLSPGGSAPFSRLQKSLAEIQGLEVLAANEAETDHMKVTVFVSKPDSSSQNTEAVVSD